MAASSTRHIEVLLPTLTEWFGATNSPYSFVKDVRGYATKAAATNSPYTFVKDVRGYATKTGATASTWTFNATTAGVRVRLGVTASTYVFTKDVRGYATKAGATASTYTFGKAVAAYDTHFGATASTYTFVKAVAGDRSAGATTHFGATASTYTFVKAVSAKITAFSSVAMPITFNATTVGGGGVAVVVNPNQGQANAPQRKRLLEGRPLHLKTTPARILVRAVAPQLTVGLVVTSPTVRASAHAAAPTFFIGPSKPATVTTIFRAERDLNSIDLDRELAVLLEA